MRWNRLVVLAVLTWLVLACAIPIPKIPTPAPLTLVDPVDLQKSVAADGATRAAVRLGIYTGDLLLRRNDAVPFFNGRFRYNVAEWEPVVRQETVGDTLRLTVNQGLGTQLALTDHEQYSNAWEVELGRSMPLDLQADLGVGAAQLELGGLPLTGFGLTAGSGDATLTWATPNPQALGTLRLTAGTGMVIASQLGNANFDRLAFIGGTGDADLDLSGAWTRSALADIKAGIGRVTVRTPAGVGVRLNFSGTPVSELHTVGFSEQGQNVYVNGDYGKVPLTLTLNVAIGAGSITVIAP